MNCKLHFSGFILNVLQQTASSIMCYCNLRQGQKFLHTCMLQYISNIKPMPKCAKSSLGYSRSNFCRPHGSNLYLLLQREL